VQIIFGVESMKKIMTAIMVLLAAALFADDAAESMRNGDHFFNRGEYNEALKKYKNAAKFSPDDIQVQWRIGAALDRIAMNLTGIAQNDTFKIANEILTKVLHKGKDIPQTHAELAWNLTFMGLFSSDIKDFAMARRIKEELDYALSIDKSNADAHFVLGLWNRQMATVSILKRKPNGLGDVSDKIALDELKKACDLKPNCALYFVELGKQYKLMGDNTQAYMAFDKASKTNDIPANKPYIAEAKKLLSESK
jgi:tetratricopeptide (TPR) repeat protein